MEEEEEEELDDGVEVGDEEEENLEEAMVCLYMSIDMTNSILKNHG